MTDDVFLDLELAVARAAEELDRITAAGPSPLRYVYYPASANVLWRWVDAHQDAPVWTFVRAYTGAEDRARVRSSLTEEDFYTLITFAQRCVLAALRNEDAGAAEAAFDALSVVDLERIADWRDVVLATSLAAYAAQRVGLGAEEVLSGAVGRATPSVAELIEDLVIQEVDLVRDWGYREVSTPAGPVLIETEGRPASDDLVARALAVADLLTDEGRYEVTSVGEQDELPDAWVDVTPEVEEARRRLLGCVSVDAELPDSPFPQSLLVFLAEAADERDAELLAATSRRRSRDDLVHLGIAVGSRCAVVIAKSNATDYPCVETDQSLARLRAPVQALLG